MLGLESELCSSQVLEQEHFPKHGYQMVTMSDEHFTEANTSLV